MTSFMEKKKRKTLEKDVVGIVTVDQIGLLPTSHIVAYMTLLHTGVCGETVNANSRKTQTTQNI